MCLISSFLSGSVLNLTCSVYDGAGRDVRDADFYKVHKIIMIEQFADKVSYLIKDVVYDKNVVALGSKNTIVQAHQLTTFYWGLFLMVFIRK